MKFELPWLRRRKPRLIDRLAAPLDDLLQVLFQEASAGIVIIDRTGRIVRVNDTVRRMVSHRVNLKPGQPVTALFSEPVWDSLRPVLEGRRAPHSVVTRLEAADPDPEHSVEAAMVLLREPDRSISGLLLRLTDLTVQKRLEAQLAHSQKLQAVGQLAGGIAHDFNNLLTAVTGAAELVLARRAVDTETREDVTQIRASADRGAALIRQLLAFGRQQRLQPRVLAINDAIQDLSSLLRRLLGGQVRLELDLETPGRMVRVDPTQLDQVLVNLAVNARDAMPGGGTLTLRSGHIALYRALTRGQETIPPGRYVMIEVEDTGVGIPPEVLPRIFDPFFTTRRERGGSGLGLSTVHGIVRQSDGFLAVDSEVGKGTRFRVYLPRHDGSERVVVPKLLTPIEQVPVATILTPSRTVLLVDDEDAVLRVAQRALTQRGWTVLACESGESALAALAEEPGLAALISDVVMPGMDGPSLVRAARTLRPGLPAVLVSGYAEESLRRDLSAEKIIFLAKPYTLKGLATALELATAGDADAQARHVADAIQLP